MVGKSKHCLKEEVVPTIFSSVYKTSRKCYESLFRPVKKKSSKCCVLKELFLASKLFQVMPDKCMQGFEL